jgi:hypothetical protein
MFNSFSFSGIALLLVFSLLAPSIETLCASDYESVLAMDFNEDENNSKESEKNFDHKELFFDNAIGNKNIYIDQQTIRNQTHILFYSNLSSEILLPPPKDLS